MKVFAAAALSTLVVGALAAPQRMGNAKARNVRRSSRIPGLPHETLDENWAGAVLNSFDSDETLQSVNATFTVPNPQFPSVKSSSYDEYTTSAWVGIDGYGCDNLWQTGIDSTIADDGGITYYAWYEWYPADTEVFDIGSISAGDVSRPLIVCPIARTDKFARQVINIAIIADSTTSGTAIIENTTTGRTVSKTMSSDNTLCLGSAEWIIEDLYVDSSSIGLANVGDFTFSNAIAGTSARTLGPLGAVIMDVELPDTTQQLTYTSITDDSVAVLIEN